MAVLHPHPPFDDLTYYPTSRWIRGTRGKDTIVDSRHAVLVWEPGKKVPIYAFPRQDVVPVSGPASFTSQPRGFADPDLDGYVTIPWDSLDHWFEEDEEVFVHPRDPFVRVDALHSSRHVRVERDGQASDNLATASVAASMVDASPVTGADAADSAMVAPNCALRAGLTSP